jgi:hypothetical protein
MPIDNFNDQGSNPSTEDNNQQLNQPVHPGQVIELANQQNMPLSVAAELADTPNLIQQIDEAYALAQQGDEEAQIVFEKLIIEFRARAQNYDSYLNSIQG